MTSDETTRQAPGESFRHRGLGMAMRFRCGACSKPSDTNGRRLRHVSGLRTYVCKACAAGIDSRRKA